MKYRFMMLRDGMLGRRRPLEEVWGDTRPGIHSVGDPQLHPVEEPGRSTEGANRTLIQSACSLLTRTAVVWGFFCARSGKGGWVSDDGADLVRSQHPLRPVPAQPAEPAWHSMPRDLVL